MEAYAICWKEGEQVLRFPISAVKPTSIGRGPGNLVQLVDDHVSKRHATIGLEDGEWRIRDCDSQNGTFVNGVKVSDAVLESDDTISIGSHRITFKIADGESFVPDHVINLSDEADSVTVVDVKPPGVG